MLNIKKISSTDKNFFENLKKYISRREFNTSIIKDRVKNIIYEVKDNGDEALIEFSSKFDNYIVSRAEELEISKEKITESLNKISKEELESLKFSNK